MRLIDADALLTAIIEYPYPYGYRGIVKSEIENLPTVDAVPAKHGRWMPREEGKVYPFWERYTCSVCGEYASDTNYCPYCGARMDE